MQMQENNNAIKIKNKGSEYVTRAIIYKQQFFFKRQFPGKLFEQFKQASNSFSNLLQPEKKMNEIYTTLFFFFSSFFFKFFLNHTNGPTIQKQDGPTQQISNI